MIIGGGAAGFFAAIHAKASKPGASILIVEKSNKLLSKVRISGGGRCNVTYNEPDPGELLKAYPRGRNLLRWVLRKWSVINTIRWFEAHGVELKTEEDGRMFPVTDDSETIANCLWKAATDLGVVIQTHCGINSIQKNENGTFTLHASGNLKLESKAVIVATGGFPKKEQFKFIYDLGIEIIDPVPSLFTFNIHDKLLHSLMGVSAQGAKIKITGFDKWYEGPVLITHWGLSGPAILKTSAWLARELNELDYKFTVLVDWTGRGEETAREIFTSHLLMHSAKMVGNAVPFDLPKRLWDFILHRAKINPEKACRDLSKPDKNRILEQCIRCEFKVKGKTTFKEEFVTAGGIAIHEIDSNTMMAKKVPGLFFVGEVIDMDGITGGFNFQAAWATGYCAGSQVLR